MDLDHIREILYAFTKEVTTFVEERGVQNLQDDVDVDAFVEEFIASNEDLVGEVDAPTVEESY